MSSAYEALIDPELRRLYNRHGHEGIQRHKDSGGASRGAHDPFDLFSQFFGGRGHFDTQEKRGPGAELRVGVGLRDFYNGAATEFSWERQHICETCDGSGSSDGVVEECPHCAGHGVVLVKRQLAPGMFQQLQSPCEACGQRGKIIKHKCPTCAG
ncbi:J domain-containing protein, partial [Candidatus Bathyarchaeota archaeon]|nr:J domain-containing protein [Candidatus Bathyarchaeota archaeon]